jgi:hypothetical protein
VGRVVYLLFYVSDSTRVLCSQEASACSTMAPRPMLDCVWNSKTGELYSTAADGAIAVFRDQPNY